MSPATRVLLLLTAAVEESHARVQRRGAAAGGSAVTRTTDERSAAAARGLVRAAGTASARSVAMRAWEDALTGAHSLSCGGVVLKIPPTKGSEETTPPARPLSVAPSAGEPSAFVLWRAPMR